MLGMISTSGRDVNSSNNVSPESLGEDDRAYFRRALLRWYGLNARDLPWRKTQNSYAILISEMMLQQTQVATALDYYERFLKTFPTITDLAEADESAVLAAWAGLGYYRRARLLHAAAKTVSDHYGGEMPASPELLRALPGVGEYTAGAIASFAFDLPAPLVDANVSRLFARLFALRAPTNMSHSKKLMWKWAGELLCRRQPRRYNNALMELGARVCTPTSPKCAQCPVKKVCRAYALNLVELLPNLPPAKDTVPLFFTGVVLFCGAKIFLKQIPTGEWHEKMWEFPKMSCATLPEQPTQELRQLVRSIASKAGFEPKYHDFRYAVTHHRITLRMWIALIPATALLHQSDCGKWFTIENLNDLPLPSPQKRIVKWVGQRVVMEALP